MNKSALRNTERKWLIEAAIPHAVYWAKDLAGLLYPPFAADMQIFIIEVRSLKEAVFLQKMLLRILAPDIEVETFSLATGEKGVVKLGRLDQIDPRFMPVDLSIAPQQKGASFEEFAQIVACLRAKDGCPWDREQTHLSLRPHLMEEAFEVLDAIDGKNAKELEEELGDLLLQIVLHAEIAQEKGDFSMGDVIKGIHAKIVRRHPHVFGDARIKGVDGVLKNWEKLKAEERELGPENGKEGIMGGVPKALPSLTQAQEYQDRAARVGFDWKTIQPVWDKVNEELYEVKKAIPGEELEHELGDLLFAVVNYIRWCHADAESLLRAANRRFVDRFRFIEAAARAQKRLVSDLSFEEMDRLWEQAKQKLK